MAEEFTGFANTLNAKGKPVDARKVKAYVDDTEAGRTLLQSQKGPAQDSTTAEGEGANAS